MTFLVFRSHYYSRTFITISISLNFQHLMHNASISHRGKCTQGLVNLTVTVVSLDKT